MAINTLPKENYGQIELNQVAWRRDGRIEAQCALDTTEFASTKAENGMLFAVDKANSKITLAKTTDVGKLPIGIHYSTEHMYDERALGLKHFALSPGEFYPRVGYLAEGDTFTTNQVKYDTTDYANLAALNTALGTLSTPIYGALHADAPGFIVLVDTAPGTGPLFRVVKKTTMPDGQAAVKLQVLRA